MVWKLIATAFFVGLNGFFVAAEFALVKVRATRIHALAQQGDRRAQLARHILDHLNRYLSACQLGITISSLVLGWLAEPAVAALLLALAEEIGIAVDTTAVHIAALALALTVITILHMTIGEQAPKIWAIQKPQRIALATVYPLRLFTIVFGPFIWLINETSNALLRMIGISAKGEHGEVQDIDELRAVLRAAFRAGHISRGQQSIGENVLRLMKLQVRHIMLPRIDVAYLTSARSTGDNLRVLADGGHSRYPFCEPDLDNVIGLVHSKDVLAQLVGGDEPVDLRQFLRPISSVPDTQPIGRLILDMQREQNHCAVVVDEHGTTVGLAFFEDALEEIVGPIYDEFDLRLQGIKKTDSGAIEMAGSVPLPEAIEVLGIDATGQEDTIGGYVTSVLGRFPAEGDQVVIDGYTATVASLSRRRVAVVRFDPPREDSSDGGEAAAEEAGADRS